MSIERPFVVPVGDKIKQYHEMPRLIHALGEKGLTVALAQGVFDIVHRGHVGYLRAASAIDGRNVVVVVGVENDEAVRLNKGMSRPINPVEDRMDVLAEFASTDYIFAYEDTPDYSRPEEYVGRYQELSPAAVVVPAWDPYRDLKEQQAADAGTQLALVHYQHENSTTRMLREVGYE